MSTSTEISKKIIHDTLTAREINKLLNLPRTRTEGLRLLNWFLHQCSDEDFLQFCISWMQNCCKAESFMENRDYAIYLLSNLLKISSSYHELKKSVSFFITTRYFDYFFKYLLNSIAGWHCIKSCLLFYRGACGPFQVNLENHLKAEIKKNKRISLMIGECYALIPCIGGGGNEDINYKKKWKIQFMNFLSAFNSVLNNLFSDVEEFQEKDFIDALLQEYETLDDSYDNKTKSSAEDLTIQLHNYSTILNCMLLNQYPVPKKVPSDIILQIICRGLSMNPRLLARNQSASIISLMKVLPEIQYILLSLLKTLIVTCKNQLLSYSHLICKLIRQILEWSESDFACGNNRHFRSLRLPTYEALCNWLVVARNGSCVELISKTVIYSAINDLDSKTKVIFLKETILQSQFKEKGMSDCKISGASSSKLSQAALKTLQFLLKFTGILLRSVDHKYLQEFVMKLVMEVQKSSVLEVQFPFDIPACRIQLYKLLLELICQPCPNWPPPISYALRFFSKGICDPSIEVSSFCSAALNFLTVIIHPEYDNGGFQLIEAQYKSSRSEVELQWRDQKQLTEMGNGEDEINRKKTLENEKKSFESDKTDQSEKDLSEESNVFSDEDSRNTVKFVLGPTEHCEKNLSVHKIQTDKLSVQTHQGCDEPHFKKRKISLEESTLEKPPSPIIEKLTESNSVKEVPVFSKINSVKERSHSEEIISLKSFSSDSMNEEGHSKARYFLRSKTKGSSEEPEEALKKAKSPENLKNTPSKCSAKANTTPNVQSAKRRPRTRGLLRIETFSEIDGNTLEKRSLEDDGGDYEEDEEDIKAAFDDSFVD